MSKSSADLFDKRIAMWPCEVGELMETLRAKWTRLSRDRNPSSRVEGHGRATGKERQVSGMLYACDGFTLSQFYRIAATGAFCALLDRH